MITVHFNDGDLTARGVGLYQWDYGQDLVITGLELPEQTEVHFAAGFMDKALIVLGKTSGGVTTVRIPDKLLETGESLKAYIYLADENKGETVRTISLPVTGRPKPEDYDSPADENLLWKLMGQVAGKADNAKLVDGALQLLSGDKEIGDRIRLPSGGSGGSGREIELRNSGSTIEWRYTDSNTWTELVRLDALKGRDGQTPEFDIREGHLYAIYAE